MKLEVRRLRQQVSSLKSKVMFTTNCPLLSHFDPHRPLLLPSQRKAHPSSIAAGSRRTYACNLQFPRPKSAAASAAAISQRGCVGAPAGVLLGATEGGTINNTGNTNDHMNDNYSQSHSDNYGGLKHLSDTNAATTERKGLYRFGSDEQRNGGCCNLEPD